MSGRKYFYYSTTSTTSTTDGAAAAAAAATPTADNDSNKACSTSLIMILRIQVLRAPSIRVYSTESSSSSSSSSPCHHYHHHYYYHYYYDHITPPYIIVRSASRHSGLVKVVWWIARPEPSQSMTVPAVPTSLMPIGMLIPSPHPGFGKGRGPGLLLSRLEANCACKQTVVRFAYYWSPLSSHVPVKVAAPRHTVYA